MTEIKAPNTIPAGWANNVFLAGSISNARDWQTEFVRMCRGTLPDSINLINPRRDNFSMDDPTVEREQISWEYNALEHSDVIIFWFSAETVAPITLFELGCYLNTDKVIFIGIDPNYTRKRDVVIQTELRSPAVAADIVHSLKDLQEKLANYLK